jgi:hypothetical protein
LGSCAPGSSVLGAALMITQSFLYNAIFLAVRHDRPLSVMAKPAEALFRSAHRYPPPDS